VIGSARTISHNAGGQFMSIQPRAEPTEVASLEVQCVADIRSLLGEAPIWSPRDSALYWFDILTPSVHWCDATRRLDQELKLGSMASVAVPKATGGLLVATPAGLMTLDVSSKRLSAFCHPESERPGNRYNDGKCDRMGRLWTGTLDMATAASRGNLFRVDADGSWKKLDSGFITLDASDGTPEGLTVDEDGCLWVAVWDAWRVSRYSPQGRELLPIRMPVPLPLPTSCCFGGDSLDTLYVISASVRLNQASLTAAPQSGSLFSFRIPGVRGLPETTFAG
jgi:sugar lactone lactonase YvrE